MPPDLEQFHRFAAALKVEDGSLLHLYPEQVEALAPFFDGAVDTVILTPKKNGKSTLIAAVALHHLLATPSASCVVVASARQQAEIILGQVRMFIRQAPALRKRMKVLNRVVVSLIDGGKIEVRASDVDTLDGLIPTLAIVDELHRHKNGDVRGVMRLSLGGRRGRMITISTAGSSMASPLGEIRARAYAMPTFERDHARRRSFARSPDGMFAFTEWCLDPEDDPDDLAIVKLVNPAPWRSIEVLAGEKDSVTPWEWLRLICNVWTEGDEPWLAPQVWDGLPTAGAIPDGAEVVVGLRVGQGHDTAALVWVRSDGQRDVNQLILTGLTRGTMSPLRRVEAEVRALTERYAVRWIA